MNSIIVSAIWGIIMMFSGVFIKNKTTPKYLAIAGAILLFIVNALELNMFNANQILQIDIDTKQMLNVNSFSLAFLAVVFLCTIIYFLLNAKDIEKVGEHVGEYFALIFFVLCGVSIIATYNT